MELQNHTDEIQNQAKNDENTSEATQNQASGNWQATKRKIMGKWGNLTEIEVDKLEGNKDSLIELVQRRYGLPRSEVERDANAIWSQP
jgi:uncharacterized protein YjbJ (UPF0337 family)